MCAFLYSFDALQIVGWLLLLQEEEDCFWSMVALIDDILPASYYSSTLVGVQVGLMKMSTCETCDM